MDENLWDYMSKNEQEQINALIKKALGRKERKKKAAAGQKQFQYFTCQCVGMEETEGDEEDAEIGELLEEEACFEFEIERLLREIYGFCLKHGLCQCAWHEGNVRKKKECPGTAAMDEELPF